MAGSLSFWDRFISETEPHDQIGLIAAAGLIMGLLIFPAYALPFAILALIIIVGVLVDLTAHGWDH